MNRLGCSTYAFGHFDLETSLKAISEIGFPVIDLSVIEGRADHYNPLGKSRDDYLELKQLIGSYGLSVSTLNVEAGDFNGAQWERHSEMVKAALECSAVLGACGITTKVGQKDSGNWDTNVNKSVRRIRELAEFAHNLGRKLSLEIPHNQTLAEDLDESLRFFNRLNHISADVTLDSSHIHAKKLDVREVATQFIGKLGHCHLRDVKDSGTHVIPGEGEIDFKFFHEMMRLAGFHRDYTIEIRFPQETSLEEIKTALAKGREHLLPLIGPVKEKTKGSTSERIPKK